MNLYKITTYCLYLASLAGCAVIINNNHFIPEFKGVDPKLEPYVNEWMALAKEHGFKFSKTISMGFEGLNKESVVGLCRYRLTFREIVMDKYYWQILSPIDRTVTVWHELTHGYCGRDHDYALGKEYRENENKEGFYKDRCPLSIMYPTIIEEGCFKKHYREYTTEMFERCEAY